MVKYWGLLQLNPVVLETNRAISSYVWGPFAFRVLTWGLADLLLSSPLNNLPAPCIWFFYEYFWVVFNAFWLSERNNLRKTGLNSQGTDLWAKRKQYMEAGRIIWEFPFLLICSASLSFGSLVFCTILHLFLQPLYFLLLLPSSLSFLGSCLVLFLITSLLFLCSKGYLGFWHIAFSYLNSVNLKWHS